MLSNLKDSKNWRWKIRPMLALVLAAWLAPGAMAQELKQLALTDTHITSFIAAQPDFAPLVVKLSEAAEKPDDSLKGELDAVSKKHGFASFDEYMDVNDNIAFVMGGINRKTMDFTEPVERLKRDLEEIKADTDIPEDEKKLALEDLELEIKSAAPLQNRENIDVVKRHFADLLKLLPDDGSEDTAGDGAPEKAPEATTPEAAPEKAPDKP
ncbi:MAG: hypothetical protein ABL894_00740 [Hyphomicrobium sp.]